jgi:hypothetical protein
MAKRASSAGDIECVTYPSPSALPPEVWSLIVARLFWRRKRVRWNDGLEDVIALLSTARSFFLLLKPGLLAVINQYRREGALQQYARFYHRCRLLVEHLLASPNDKGIYVSPKRTAATQSISNQMMRALWNASSSSSHEEMLKLFSVLWLCETWYQCVMDQDRLQDWEWLSAQSPFSRSASSDYWKMPAWSIKQLFYVGDDGVVMPLMMLDSSMFRLASTIPDTAGKCEFLVRQTLREMREQGESDTSSAKRAREGREKWEHCMENNKVMSFQCNEETGQRYTTLTKNPHVTRSMLVTLYDICRDSLPLTELAPDASINQLVVVTDIDQQRQQQQAARHLYDERCTSLLTDRLFAFHGSLRQARRAYALKTSRATITNNLRTVIDALGWSTQSPLTFDYETTRCPQCDSLACIRCRVTYHGFSLANIKNAEERCGDAPAEGEKYCRVVGCCHGCVCKLHRHCPLDCRCDCHLIARLERLIDRTEDE